MRRRKGDGEMEKFKLKTRIMTNVIWEEKFTTEEIRIKRNEFEEKVGAVAEFMNESMIDAILRGVNGLL